VVSAGLGVSAPTRHAECTLEETYFLPKINAMSTQEELGTVCSIERAFIRFDPLVQVLDIKKPGSVPGFCKFDNGQLAALDQST
jgi:hypothetical protein